jgi:hypothetical protein
MKKGCRLDTKNTPLKTEIMRTKVFPIQGSYNREGSRLTSSDGSGLIITHRTPDPTKPNKAENFLLYVTSEGRKDYVSSLWETTTTGLYSFEYGGTRYSLDLTKPGTAEVKPKNHKCP